MNDEFIAIVLVFIILAIIGIIYYFYIYNSDESRRERYRELYNLSNGGYDINAENALGIVSEVEHPAAEDTFTAGNIIGFNVLQGRLGGRHENFEVAEQTVGHLQDTIGNILTGNIAGLIAREFMVDHVEAFAENNLRELMLEADIDFWRPVVVGLGVTLGEIPAARDKIMRDRREKAAKTATNRVEYAENLLEGAKTHTSDSQNVHDSSVVRDLNNTLNKIKDSALPGSKMDTVREIEDFMQTRNSATSYQFDTREDSGSTKQDPNEIKGDKIRNARQALAEIKKDAYLSAYDATECEILKYVWDRTKLPENEDNSENMKRALVDELANCVSEHGGLVCTGGRASRILGSLVLQDTDSTLGAAATLEQYKNEIFDECRKMIQSEVDYAKNNNTEHATAALSYSDPKVAVREEEENKFKQHLKEQTDEILLKYKPKLSEQQYTTMRNDCYAAID